uniref:RNA-directed DNA polymerase n=1 Tax=Trichogramma kaykai TaxID=54128 RepID=A0ABD2WAQ9_9HYME
MHVSDKRDNILFLVDSGSSVSLLPKARSPKPLTVQPLTLYAANHAPIATYGTLKKTLNLGLRRDFQCDFTIADVPLAILGADFLAHHGLLPDCKNQEIIDSLTGLRAKGSLRVAPIHSVSTLETAEENTVAQQYARLVDEFSDLFEQSAGPVQIKSLPVKHNIITTGPTISERPRRLTGDRLAAAKKVFDDLLNQGIIRPSNSQWASPLHLVPKRNGSWRVTGDYRRLNAVTVPDRYPLPIIEDLLQESPGKVFSTVDLQKAFYQIPVAEQDIEKTAVTTPFGLFEFLGTSLGLRNSAQTMQRTINHVLRKLPFAKAYVDDIFVASNSHAEHLMHLRQLFETLREANLKINRQKCTFGKPQVLYLGYQVSSDGFRPPPAKIEAISDYPQPTNATELRRFLGMVNYYRQCLPRAAHIQAPLHELLKGLPNKKAKLRWTETALQAFKSCKESIVDATCNTFLRPDAELALRTDASNIAIGAALEQKEPDGSWRPLGFFSRKLDPTQRKYSTYDRELLAVSASIKHFERILEGRTFTTWTDHRPLVYAAQQRSDKASPRQVRSLEFISRFNTTLKHARGEDNVVADALSRTEPSEDTAQDNEVCNNNETLSRHQDDQISNVEVSTISMPSVLTPSSIAEAQANDDELRNLQNSSLDLQRIVLNGFDVWCDVAHGVVRPYLPERLRRQAFEVLHNLSHPGIRTTARTVAEKSIFTLANGDPVTKHGS